MRDQLLAALDARLSRIAGEDFTPVLEPEAVAEARRLADVLDADDGLGHFVLGWFHWARTLALPSEQAPPEAEAALAAFATYFRYVEGEPDAANGTYGMPAELVAAVVDAAAPRAVRLAEELAAEPEPVLAHAAVALWLRVIAATPPEHPARAARLSTLAAVLRERFQLLGDWPDIEAAVELGRDAVADTPRDAPHRSAVLSTLGAALLDRSGHFGAADDLSEAVTLLSEAAGADADARQTAATLANLGGALRRRFLAAGDPADLDAAVDAWAEAAALGGERQPARLVGLANALLTRHGHRGDPADLDAAIGWLAGAVERAGDDRAFAHAFATLGIARHTRFEERGDPADLDDAIDAGRAALAATPEPGPARASHLLHHGLALRARHRLGGPDEARAAADAAEGASAWQEAHAMASAPAGLRVEAAARLSHLHEEEGEIGRAADAAEAAVSLLPLVSPRRLRPAEQRSALGRYPGLASRAAELALADPRHAPPARAERALRLLEAGRAVLLGQALETRDDLAELRVHHPELAERFVTWRDWLDRADTDAADTDALPAGADRARPAREVARVLAEIRARPGFEAFGRPPTVEELRGQAHEGPIVVLTCGERAGHALLLTPEGVRALELPALTAPLTARRVDALRHALRLARSGRLRAQRLRGQATVNAVLEWLWDAAAGPVLDALGIAGPGADGSWPRVWWVPGGLVGLLPLHAAGHHSDPAEAPNRRTVMDRAIPSTVPSVRALRRAREHLARLAERPAEPARGLVIAMPTTPGLPGGGRLRHAAAEADLVAQQAAETVLLTTQDGHPNAAGAPTADRVLAALADRSLAHFACHAEGQDTDPARGRLLLADHAERPFTVGTLATARLERAELAYLSACHTAAGATNGLADESLHLTSAFQLAGFPRVIGTLWEVDDRIALDIAESFYARLATTPAHAPAALHATIRTLRDAYPNLPTLWAAHLHAGA
ncbi:CHAT domain-containing protein [Streptomyces sp. 3MP-14]|uniref:CHAT domain-containing protein n=1 Tax=Streptomyces mimosae TaxID=2586635 RepID=A0A5N6ASB7_9ACTN|nr:MULTISPECIES: CHAT domain-containing protein [Streptomyces]KAB8171002.1 CHAT domain-containing protein [Streptomyces mimosae]KAB8179647.1 CHAT domain-containing protein [Streptomyces sp. 3MP-14]